MRKALIITLLVSMSLFAQTKPEIEAKAKPLIERLKEVKASIYDYKKAINDGEKLIADLNKQLNDLQAQYNAILEEEKKNPPKK